MSNEVYNPDFIEVGDLIRKCRENAGMTQADLSAKADFGEKTANVKKKVGQCLKKTRPPALEKNQATWPKNA